LPLDTDLPTLVTLARCQTVWEIAEDEWLERINSPEMRQLVGPIVREDREAATPALTAKLRAIRELAGIGEPDPPRSLWDYLREV
jgi:hypothetical protein